MNASLIAVGIAVALVLSGCSSDNNPQPVPTTPSPAVSPSETASEAPTPTPEDTKLPPPPRQLPKTPEPTEQPKPSPSATSSEAGTPATQFASRWGKRHPDVPEYLILKTANGVCRLIDTAGNNWNDSPLVMSAITNAVSASGIASNDALEFAQDAEQNYCSSVSNPT